jgi:hypothetical protein
MPSCPSYLRQSHFCHLFPSHSSVICCPCIPKVTSAFAPLTTGPEPHSLVPTATYASASSEETLCKGIGHGKELTGWATDAPQGCGWRLNNRVFGKNTADTKLSCQDLRREPTEEESGRPLWKKMNVYLVTHTGHKWLFTWKGMSFLFLWLDSEERKALDDNCSSPAGGNMGSTEYGQDTV